MRNNDITLIHTKEVIADEKQLTELFSRCYINIILTKTIQAL